MRVGNAVEHEQQRRRGAKRFERLLELRLGIARTRRDFDDHTLMPLAVGELVELRVVGFDDGDTGLPGERAQFLQAGRGITRCGEPQLPHALR